jgi:membrane associated rhomboid family serine protease
MKFRLNDLTRDPRTLLISLNVLIFIFIRLSMAFHFLNGAGQLNRDLYLAASADMDTMLQRPWSILTHMFAHIEFLHFLINTIALYFAGGLFGTVMNKRKLIAVYLLGGLCGYLFFLAGFQFFILRSMSSLILGASGAVMAIIVSTGVAEPTYRIRLFDVFDVQLRWLVAFLVIVDLVAIGDGQNSGGHLGHLGGAFFGLVYGLNYRNNHGKAGIFASWGRAINNAMKPAPALKVTHREGRPKTDDEFNAERAERQRKVDEILDKISRSGYDSLTKGEKEFLFKHAQK